MSNNNLNIKSSTIEKGLELAKDFLGKLILPTVEEVGLLAADNVKIWRFKNQVRLLNNVEKYITKNKIAPKKVPLKILLPLLENASLEEEPEIIILWESLLINYIDSNKTFNLSVFPKILSEISTNQAVLLKSVDAYFTLDSIENLKLIEYEKILWIGNPKYKNSPSEISNLIRLGLLKEVNSYTTINDYKNIFPGQTILDEKFIALTPLGEEFIKICNI